MQAILSIHDVMPETLIHVHQILQSMQHIPTHKVTLLVVPGKDWSPSDVKQLKQWQINGYILAGHGWQHRCIDQKNKYHRLHSLFLSRNSAEHLSQSTESIHRIMQACFHWFHQQHLPVSSLYVPPAWALGRWKTNSWHAVPFTMIETTSGIMQKNGKTQRLPLLGFEADTVIRSSFLRLFNCINHWISKKTKRPVRIAIHPFDLQFNLSQNLLSTLSNPYHWISYEDLSISS